MFMLLVAATYGQYTVTLRVVDYTKGTLTNAPGTWAEDKNIFVAGASANLIEQNPYFHDNNQFYGMFDQSINWGGGAWGGDNWLTFPNGLLTKDDEKWTWQVTFNVEENDTYQWNAERIDSWSLLSEAMTFYTDAEGKVTGDTVLVLGLTPKRNLTFQVDMSEQTVSPQGVWTTGSFCSWAEPGADGSIQLLDSDADNIYTATTQVYDNATAISFWYGNGTGWGAKETIVGACVPGDNNRMVIVDGADVVLPAVLFGSCDPKPQPQAAQTIYIDLGLPTYLVSNPDANGNYWNNKSFANGTAMQNQITPLPLINSDNEATPYTLQITQKFNSNGGTGNGGLDNPDPALLGDLAVANATLDYLFVEGSPSPMGKSGAFAIRHLDPQKPYKFYLFGTRSNPEVRTDSFLITGLNSCGGSQQTSGTGIGSAGGNGNDNNIYISELIYPNVDSTIIIEINRKASAYAAISAIKIEEWKNIPASDYTFAKKIYFDFGSSTTETTNPDGNGNYWNNISFTGSGKTTDGTQFELVDNENNATSYTLETVTAFDYNETSPGGLTAPDVDLLGDFGIASSTQDYIFGNSATGSSIKLTGLNPSKGYKFNIFGSRDNTEVRLMLIDIAGATSIQGRHTASGTGLGASAIEGTAMNQNTSSVFVSDIIHPDNNGEILITINKINGSYYHLNAMRVDEYDYAGAIAPSSITLSADPATIINTGATSQITATVEPEGAIGGVQYYVISGNTAAWVDNSGVIHPKNNGTVTVVGRIAYDDIDISDTIEIVIMGQVKGLSISGTATETEGNLPLHFITDTNNTATNLFEIYTRLKPGTFTFTADNGDTYGDGCGTNCIIVEGSPIATTLDTTVRISINLSTLTYTITPVHWGFTGNVSDGCNWCGSGYPKLNYVGNGVWQGTHTLNGRATTSDHSRINFIANNNWEWIFDKVKGNNGVTFRAYNPITGDVTEDCNTNFAGGTFLITLDLQNYTFDVSCVEENEKKITVIGSSTPRGTGATNDYGYTQMYGTLLGERYEGGISTNNWQLSNVCINGNYTGSVWNRWQYDLIQNCAKYVMIGLTYGNEMDNVKSSKEDAFISYQDNLRKMIDSLRTLGKIPVVGTPYVRADYTDVEYDYIKRLNLIISKWDVPSTNLLSAADDLTGKYVTGYWNGNITVDKWHPNDAGHREFYHSLVPSLFDALEAGKPAPVRNTATEYKIGSHQKDRISFVPEDTAHSFTLSVAFRSTDSGEVLRFHEFTGDSGVIKINSAGKLVYTSAAGSIENDDAINDNDYHRATITHYHALGKTLLYIDSTFAGSQDEKIVASRYYLGGNNSPDTIYYKELLFYRSAITEEAVKAIVNGDMLQSSLEIYAPLGVESTPLKNFAQSTNTVFLLTDSATVTLEDLNYNLPRTEVYTGKQIHVPVTPKNPDMGAITVKYNGDTTAPTAIGKYEITVDIKASEAFKAVDNLLLDTLTIIKARIKTSNLNYVVPSVVIYDGEEHSVEVTYNTNIEGAGTITVTYNGETEAPIEKGTYQVKACIGEGENYFADTFTLGTMVIKRAWYFTLSVVDMSKGVITNKVNDQNEINIIAMLSENLAVHNSRVPEGWWYPMYNDAGVAPTGELVKTDTSWNWTITLLADTGTYWWLPFAKTLGWKRISDGMYNYTADKGDTLVFSINEQGEITGSINLIIPNPTPVSILPVKEKSNLYAYINNGMLFVSPEAKECRVISITGQQVLLSKAEGTAINVSHLKAGIYLIRLRNSSEVKTIKVIKIN